VVKIDRSFTHDIDKDPTQAAIVTSVIEMSHRLGLKVVAEGVESQSQQQFLHTHGCDLIQGYWLARPLSLESSLEFLQSTERRIRA
jgi:EAL domain-containing protein (putative c-di-GMP-specific phosphodiesterase class I)